MYLVPNLDGGMNCVIQNLLDLLLQERMIGSKGLVMGTRSMV